MEMWYTTIWKVCRTKKQNDAVKRLMNTVYNRLKMITKDFIRFSGSFKTIMNVESSSRKKDNKVHLAADLIFKVLWRTFGKTLGVFSVFSKIGTDIRLTFCIGSRLDFCER